MANQIGRDNEDYLQSVFNSSQDIQTRIFRILARGAMNEYSIAELESQLRGMMASVKELKSTHSD